jgi:hypothetical protein
MHIYSNEDLKVIKDYRLESRVEGSNKRFKQYIIVLDLLNSIKRLGFRCYYCQEPLDKKTWQLDHFHSKKLGGKNEPNNLAPSCKWCNQMKNALDGNSFLVRCKKIVISNLNTEIPDPVKRNVNTLLKDFPINMSLYVGKSEHKKNPNLSKLSIGI